MQSQQSQRHASTPGVAVFGFERQSWVTRRAYLSSIEPLCVCVCVCGVATAPATTIASGCLGHYMQAFLSDLSISKSNGHTSGLVWTR